MLLPRVPRSGSQSIGVPDLFAWALRAQRMLTDAGFAFRSLAGGGAAGSLNLVPSPLPAAALPALGAAVRRDQHQA